MNAPTRNAPTAEYRFLLVMTATVTPAVHAEVRRSDPQVRLEDYKTALRFWLADPHPALDRILFLENSGADLTDLRAIAERENSLKKEVEFLSLPVHDAPPGINYGYSEMQLLDEGLTQSKLRQATTHMIKATGRLTFPALGKALDKIANFKELRSRRLELMVDCRKLGFPRRGYDASVQLFVCSHDFFDSVLRNSKSEMNSTDLRLLEHLIFRKAIPFKGRPGYYLRFPCNIDPVGYSGFKSRRYDSARTAISRGIRGILRVVVPDHWY